MHCETRENWPFSGLFFDFRVILTSGGYLLKITLKDSPEPLLKKEASPAVLGGERIPEMLWSLQVP